MNFSNTKPLCRTCLSLLKHELVTFVEDFNVLMLTTYKFVDLRVNVRDNLDNAFLV